MTTLRPLCLIAALLITSTSLAEERTDVIGTLVPLGDSIEFVLTEYHGCRTAHKDHPLQHGAVFDSGRDDIPGKDAVSRLISQPKRPPAAV